MAKVLLLSPFVTVWLLINGMSPVLSTTFRGEYPHRACTARARRPHRVRYLNNFPRRWSTGRGVVNGTWWALRCYHSP